LNRILPMPETPFGKTGADLHLFNLVPLYGRVKSLPESGGSYRAHGANHFHSESLATEQMRKTIRRSTVNHRFLYKHAIELNMKNIPARPSDILSVTYIANRLASLQLDPERHPLRHDTRRRLVWLGLKASKRRFDLPVRVRLVYMAWFVVTSLSPRLLAGWMVSLVFFPSQRRGLRRLI
jgi:hypothetical protein